MQRRLVKALEDLSVQYDYSVRNSTGDMIQFLYGGDALDPTYMEGKDRPVDFQRAFDHIKAVCPYKNEDPLDEKQLIETFHSIATTDAFLNCGEEFREEFKYYAQ
jgi:DNA-directed RNA polymerase III subunit RPC1